MFKISLSTDWLLLSVHLIYNSYIYVANSPEHDNSTCFKVYIIHPQYLYNQSIASLEENVDTPRECVKEASAEEAVCSVCSSEFNNS